MPMGVRLFRLRPSTHAEQQEAPAMHATGGGLQKQRSRIRRQRQHRQREKKPIRQDGTGGLLITDDSELFSVKFAIAAFAELLGVMLFSLLGSSCPPDYIPAGNGFTLAVLIYITANVSGGHLNPCVTIATLITGHISILKALIYIVSQIVGAILGSFLAVGLRPGLSTGGGIGPGCFTPGMPTGSQEYLSLLQAAGWEFFFTFILVSTVFAVAIGKPSFGNVGPGIVGLSLYACASVGVPLTGASLNVARTLGPFVVFQCFGDKVWAYVLAELAGGVVAGIMSWPLYGTGPEFMRFVEQAAHEESLRPEASEFPGGTDIETGFTNGITKTMDLEEDLEERVESNCEPDDTMVSQKEDVEKGLIDQQRLQLVSDPSQDLTLRDRFAAPTVDDGPRVVDLDLARFPSAKFYGFMPPAARRSPSAIRAPSRRALALDTLVPSKKFLPPAVPPIPIKGTFALAPPTLRHVSPEPSALAKQTKAAPRNKFAILSDTVGVWNRI